MIFSVTVLIVGAILTIAGWYGPEDDGVLAAIGLALMGLALYKGWPFFRC